MTDPSGVRVAHALRQSVTDSTVGSSVAKALGAARRLIDGWLAPVRSTAATRWNDAVETARIARIGDGSRLIKTADRILVWVPTAWRRSRTGGSLRGRWHTFLTLELEQRIRLLGCALMTAVPTAAAISWLAGTPTNLAQRAVSILLLVIAIALVAASQPLANAWRERAGRGRRAV